jgi:maltose-binding protein MalE
MQAAQEFTAAYGVPVEVVEVPFGDIRGNLAVTAPTGEGPDVIIGPHDWIGELIYNGLLEPIFLPADVLAAFDPVALDAFSWAGELYGLPYATECVALMYNKDLVPEVPATFEELIEVAKALTAPEKGQYGFLIQQPDPYHTFPLHSAGGGYIFGTTPEGTLDPCDIGLDNEGSIKGAMLLDRLVKEGIEFAGADYQTVTGLFNEGLLGMFIGGPWTLSGIQAAGINYGVAKIPPIEGNTPRPFIGAQGFMVSAFSENKILANLFLKDFLATKDIMLLIYEEGQRPPAYLPALAELADNPDIQAFAASAAAGIPMPKIPEMASVWGAWSDALELIVSQKLGPKEAMENAAEQIRTLLGCK